MRDTDVDGNPRIYEIVEGDESVWLSVEEARARLWMRGRAEEQEVEGERYGLSSDAARQR